MSFRVSQGGMFHTLEELRILYQVADLGTLRNRYRVANSRVYEILNGIARTVFADADPGNEPRQSSASGHRGIWTVGQVAREAGLSDRTVRLDCQHGILPAEKTPAGWTITPVDAATYIAARRKT